MRRRRSNLKTSRRDIVTQPAMAASAAVAVSLIGAKGIQLVGLTGGLGLALGYGMKERLGGRTGDAYRAIFEMCEAAIRVAALALGAHGWLG